MVVYNYYHQLHREEPPKQGFKDQKLQGNHVCLHGFNNEKLKINFLVIFNLLLQT